MRVERVEVGADDLGDLRLGDALRATSVGAVPRLRFRCRRYDVRRPRDAAQLGSCAVPECRTQARGRPRRARAPRRLAPAPAAALARRPALQRVGGRRRRRHRARSTPACTTPGSLAPPRAGAGAGQPAPRARPAARLHARALRPLRPGGDDRSTRAGCELWMHPNHGHMTRAATDPDDGLRAPARDRPPVAACPSEPLRARTPRRARGRSTGVAAHGRARSRARRGRRDRHRPRPLGASTRRPGHAPSHVCLHQPERRLLISGDHLLGRISLYYDYRLHARSCRGVPRPRSTRSRRSTRGCACPGHGRTFTDVQAHIEANRKLVAERVDRDPRGRRGARAAHRIRRDPARLRRGGHGGQRHLVAQRDALLPDAPRGARPCRADPGGERGAERWSLA